MTWTIWTTKTYTGDLLDCIAMYHNHGHALSAIRGLRKRAWLAGSEVNYVIRKG